MAGGGPLPPVDYTSRDFASMLEDMKNAIPERLPEWTSRSTSDFGIVLLELFAYVGDTLSYYGDRIANEAYLSTAVERGSVLRAARMLDYRPTGTHAAEVVVQFTTTPGAINTLLLTGTRVATSGTDASAPLIYETTQDALIEGGNAQALVSAAQGITIQREVLSSSDGSRDQERTLFHAPMIDGSLALEVDEVGTAVDWIRWSPYLHLVDAGADEPAYSTWVDEHDIVHISFGDDVNGRIPTQGARLRATYRVGGGAVGNVGPGTITTMVENVPGVAGVTNPGAATGGVDAETTDQIRANAPKSFSAVQRAVSAEDYAALAMRVPGVAKTAVISSVYTSVLLHIAPLGGGAPGSLLRQAVRDYLAPRKMTQVTVTVLDPAYVPVNITAGLDVREQHVTELVRRQVEETLAKRLSFDAVDFGGRISLAEVYRTILDVEGVNYASVYLLARADAAQTGTLDVVLGANEIPQAGVVVISPVTGGIPL